MTCYLVWVRLALQLGEAMVGHQTTIFTPSFSSAWKQTVFTSKLRAIIKRNQYAKYSVENSCTHCTEDVGKSHAALIYRIFLRLGLHVYLKH